MKREEIEDEHRVTMLEDGGWKAVIHQDGSVEHREHRTREFIEGKCSCGETFESSEEAFNHIEEVSDEPYKP